jgi:hypothetical protein
LRSVSSWLVAGRRGGSDPDPDEGVDDSADTEEASEEPEGQRRGGAAAAALMGRGESLRGVGTGEENGVEGSGGVEDDVDVELTADEACMGLGLETGLALALGWARARKNLILSFTPPLSIR